MAEKHCETDCREEILGKISNCVLKDGVWKFIGIIVTVLIFTAGIALSIHAASSDRMEERQKIAESQIHTNTISIAKIQQTLDTLREGQIRMDIKLENLGATIIKEVKKSR